MWQEPYNFSVKRLFPCIPADDALAGKSRMEEDPSLGGTDSTVKGQGAALGFHGHGCGVEDQLPAQPCRNHSDGAVWKGCSFPAGVCPK